MKPNSRIPATANLDVKPATDAPPESKPAGTVTSLRIQCPSCQTPLSIPDTLRGKTVRCPKCKATTTVPAGLSPGSRADSSNVEEAPTILPSPGSIKAERPEASASTKQLSGKDKSESSEVLSLLHGDQGERGEALPTIPGFEVLGILGRGGMGVVYKARQVGLKRLVALKMILSGAYASQDERSRFVREAEAVARLQHPNIVQIHQVGEHDGNPYFSLEYCDAGSLGGLLNGTPLPAADAAHVVRLLAQGMQAAHDQNIIHRDLKPANVLLASGQRKPSKSSEPSTVAEDAKLPRGSKASTGRDRIPLDGAVPKITDFGLAKQLDEAGQTASGAVMGTPSYMAPEQASGETKALGPAADVYALGAILYECLTGRPPFKAATSLETILMVVGSDPVPPSQLNPKTPRDLETICLKCLQKEPRKRYGSAAELAEDLRRFVGGEPILARPVSSFERAVKLVRRRPMVASLLALLLLVSMAGFAAVLWQLGETEKVAADLVAEQKDKLAEQQAKLAEQQANLAEQQAKLAEQEKKREQDRVLKLNQQRLNVAWPGEGPRSGGDRLSINENGKLSLNLSSFPNLGSDGSNLTPLQGMKLDSLNLDKCKVKDLSALRGMPLTKLNLEDTQVQDRDLQSLRGMELAYLNLRGATQIHSLEPLKGLPLTVLSIGKTQVQDLTPLKGMPLTRLDLLECTIVDLEPLKGMKLNWLSLAQCGRVRDLAPLKAMPLNTLNLADCSQLRDLESLRGLPLIQLDLWQCKQIRDLEPLKGMRLKALSISGTGVTDLRPLHAMELEYFGFFPENITQGLDILRGMKSLKTIGRTAWARDQVPAAEFWDRYDKGEFRK